MDNFLVEQKHIMEQFFDGVIGFILGVGVAVGCILVGFAIYIDSDGAGGILSLVISAIVGIGLFFGITKTVLEIGITNFITAAHATPELNYLKPAAGDDYNIGTPQQLVNAFDKKQLKNTKGLIRIWGSKKSYQLSEWLIIKAIRFDEENEVLYLDFYERNQLIVHQPQNLLISTTNFTIIKANKIEWNWEGGKRQKKAVYTYSRRKVIIQSIERKGFDRVSPQSPAVDFLYQLD